MSPEFLAISFVVLSVVAMWGIRVIGDWLYPPPKARRNYQPSPDHKKTLHQERPRHRRRPSLDQTGEMLRRATDSRAAITRRQRRTTSTNSADRSQIQSWRTQPRPHSGGWPTRLIFPPIFAPETNIMTPEFTGLMLLSLFALAAVGLLFLGGWFFRYDHYLARIGNSRPRSRIIEDLRPAQNLTLDFFAQAKPCARLLAVLARHRQPVAVRAVLQEARPTADALDNGGVPPLGTGWAALWIMRVAGLVSFTKRGVLLTDHGREVHRRISTADSKPAATTPFKSALTRDAMPVALALETGGTSHLHRVRQAMERNEHNPAQGFRAFAPADVGRLRTLGHDSATTSSSRSLAISETVPAEIITMNTRGELLDLDTQDRMEFALVHPADADIKAGKISVLSSLGLSMLGQRLGEEFEWTIPYGVRRLKVTAVRLQPDATLAIAA